jgi:hypothetical protein
MILESPALIAFSEDIKNRSFSDWIIAHTSFMYPLHAYSGTIKIEGNIFLFNGIEKKTGQEFHHRIFRNEIEEVYHGFDDVFTRFETRNLGFGWKPLRITYIQKSASVQLYLIVNYALGRTDNAIWFETLKNWLRA